MAGLEENVAIGHQLHAARLHRDVSLDAASEATRIRQDFLAALESDHWEALPGEVYGQGFLRTYAKFLDLDGDDLVAKRRQVMGQPPLPTVAPPMSYTPSTLPKTRLSRKGPKNHLAKRRAQSSSKGPETSYNLAWVVVVIIVLSVGGVFLSQNHSAAKKAHLASSPVASNKVTARRKKTHQAFKPSAKTKKSTTTHSITATAPLKVSTVSNNHAGLVTYQVNRRPAILKLSFSGPCWVEQWKNGTTSNPSGHTYYAGQSLTITGSRSVAARLGSHAVSMKFNGQTVALPGPKNVVLQVTLQAK